MTHEANLSGDLLEDEIWMVKEELAKESNENENSSPQAWDGLCYGVML